MNQIIKAGQTFAPPAVGTRDGNWMWDGTRWVCDPDCDFPQFPQPCPPFGPPVFSGPAGQPPWYPGANGGVSFGATAPPNPVRGHFWWDGKTLWMFDGAAWVATGGAAGGGNTPPSGTPPANPQPGQQWFNGTTLFVWDGNAWIPVSQTKTTISATAPSSPGPGDLWFDGTQLRIWDGSAWELVGPGATVGPVPTTTETFLLTKTSTSAIGVNTWALVPFASTPSIDTTNAWDGGTYKITPKKPGNYYFQATAYLQGSGTAGSYDGIAILKNDSGVYNNNNVANIGFNAASLGFSSYVQTSSIIKFNGTTDFIRLWAFTTDGNVYATSPIPMIHGWLLP